MLVLKIKINSSMQISWKGQACFHLLGQASKNNQVSLVIDPYDEKIGFKLPKMEADILLVTHEHFDHNNKEGVASSNTFVIDGPGEYDVKNVFIQGIHSWHDDKEGKERGSNTIYVLNVEDLRLCHLGDLGQKELSDKQVEQIGDIDILMVPVGGTYTIDAKGAAKIISQIEPRIVIPMHYKTPKLKIKLDEVDLFLKEMGVKEPEYQNKLSIKSKDLPAEGMKVLVLKN